MSPDRSSRPPFRPAKDAIEKAKVAGLTMLAARDLTRQELTERLGRKSFDAIAIEQATLELEAMGAIDDERVAREHARKRRETDHAATSLIETELLDRGIEGAIVSRVLMEASEIRDEGAEALELARDRVRRSKPDLKPEMVIRRAFEFLRRKGYDEETCRAAAERAAKEYLGRP
jgi:SOS response regulatory protein OraA/RecX